MEKRLLLAVFLMSIVMLATSLLFPPEPPPEETPADAPAAAVQAPLMEPPPAPLALPAATEDSVLVASPLYRYTFSTRGAALVRAELPDYASYVRPGEPVQLVPTGATDLLAPHLVLEGDTLDLGRLHFAASDPVVRLRPDDGERHLRFQATAGHGIGVEVQYTFAPNTYRIGVRGRVAGLAGRNATLLTGLGPGIAPNEALAHHSERELAVVTRSPEDLVRRPLRKVQGREWIPGPLTWAGVKDKYFFIGLIAGDSTPLSGAMLQPRPGAEWITAADGDTTRIELPRAQTVAALPLSADGTFAYDLYVGPQDHDRLAAIGYDLEEVTPYGYRWLRPIIRPFASLILWVLHFLHENLGWAYGWTLVAFGVIMRVLLWPLNARAMRSQMKNMVVQPELQARMKEVRERYKDDPARQQKEMMNVYQELGVNPLSMMSGCLPLLIPFPVLITLFFVFQNTISFRGAEFLWLPDLSLPDPWRLLPIFLVVSAFALQWISTRMSGMEENPQMKMMMYVMPLMMGVFFFNLPAGLNLYYATTNVATVPQQILIARERRRMQDEINREKEAAAPKAKPRPPAAGSARGQRRTRRKS